MTHSRVRDLAHGLEPHHLEVDIQRLQRREVEEAVAHLASENALKVTPSRGIGERIGGEAKLSDSISELKEAPNAYLSRPSLSLLRL